MELALISMAKSWLTGSAVAAPRYKVGKPAKLRCWYYPERDLTYDQTGIGSWYGVPEFAGKLTANAEICDLNWSRLRKTLPVLSVVRVTNVTMASRLFCVSMIGAHLLLAVSWICQSRAAHGI